VNQRVRDLHVKPKEKKFEAMQIEVELTLSRFKSKRCLVKQRLAYGPGAWKTAVEGE
jgi:hypothetical protein